VGALRAQAQAAAQAQALGDLFEYKLKQPVTIQKNRSALVPIVQSPIEAEKVSIWNEQAGFPRPQRALWLTNSSGLEKAARVNQFRRLMVEWANMRSSKTTWYELVLSPLAG